MRAATVAGVSAFLIVAAAPAPAQEASGNACAAFDRVEAEGRDQVERRIAEIDKAAAAGDMSGFCRASDDLLFVYRSLQAAAAACSEARAARWGQAAEESRAALAKTCP